MQSKVQYLGHQSFHELIIYFSRLDVLLPPFELLGLTCSNALALSNHCEPLCPHLVCTALFQPYCVSVSTI